MDGASGHPQTLPSTTARQCVPGLAIACLAWLLTWLAAAIALAAPDVPESGPPGQSGSGVDAPLPLPEGFVRERREEVEWVFPEAARSRVRELQDMQRSAWRRTAGELGALGEPRFTVRVARDPEEMQRLAPAGVTLPDYAVGVALPSMRLVLLCLTAPDTWQTSDLETTFVHELSHMALHEAVGGHPVPRWFAEGLAIDQADEHSIARIRHLWEATVRGKLLPLSELSRAFPAHPGDVNAAYAQSADFVAFLRDGDDERTRFHELIEALAEGEAFEQAFVDAFQVPLGYMEREWRHRLHERYGRLPLLLTSLTALWALGALLLVAAYFRKRHNDRTTMQRWADEELRTSMLQPTELQAEPREAPESVAPPPSFVRVRRMDSEIPTIEYDGKSHTLH